MLPGTTAPAAKSAIRGILDEMSPKVQWSSIGTADSSADSTATLEALVAQADFSLAQDRVSQGGADTSKKTINPSTARRA